MLEADPPLPELYRKLSRALTSGRGIRLSAAEVDLLAVSGAYDVISKAAADELRQAAQSRLEERAARSSG